jgi:FkbH-like protein
LNLLEALELSRKPVADDARPLHLFLACGFTPLHLQTFLGAHLREFFPEVRIEIKTGLYGDLAGSLERLNATGLDALVAVVEWSDLDPRLGIRSLGGWQVSALPEVISSAQAQLSRLERAFITAAHSSPVVVSLPTLPVPPLFFTPSYLGSAERAELSFSLAKFALTLSRERRIRVLDSQALELAAPLNSRYDIKSEILTGFPYKLPYTATFARMLASLVSNRTPKKGLITDLDDTMWAGIVGEVGVDGINWTLEQHSQVHGLYQQLLSSLASAGVLIGVASKNDPALVQEAFARKDLLLNKESVFPFEVHWNAKSESVQRILKLWNIGPEAVVFVDDSPMEVAEVQAVFPQVECLVFKKDDCQAVWELLVALRDRFGKASISTEDSLRLESLRNAAPLLDALGQSGSASDDFLKRADSLISFGSAKHGKDARALELVNKTNQFNLNGVRFTEADWSRLLADPSSLIVVVSYRDKYGPLGKIAVITGKVLEKRLHLNAWVMSCRAFSRRIEHHCLKYLFEKFNADEIVFDFQITPRNGPLQDFFVELLGSPPQPGLTISRTSFFAKLPPLFHNVEEKENG